MCGTCIERYDHHCQWLNTCVGQANYRNFLSFILALWLYLIYVIILVADQVCFKLGQPGNIELNPFAILDPIFYNIYMAQLLFICLGLVSLVLIFPVSSLVYLHVQNVCEGITTYERFHKN